MHVAGALLGGNARASAIGALTGSEGISLAVRLHNTYRFECHRQAALPRRLLARALAWLLPAAAIAAAPLGSVLRPVGRLRWQEDVHNLVTTEGKNDLLTKYLKASSYTAAWYAGLVSGSSPTLAAGDTAAQIGGSNGWTEFTAYSESVRQTATYGSASAGSIDNSASKAVFSINGGGTVGGAFLVSTSTKSGTSGVLFGEAAFGTARTVVSGDTLSVTLTNTV
ncbi:MAG: hypothetical protein WDN25_03955 [Acetobacteraceae bacterium]